MRTLSRPMFNMGGPIKEGVMHGIREPYKGGGKAALVGNPVYPKTGGREHHALVLGAMAPWIPAALTALRSIGPAAVRGWKAARYGKPWAENLGKWGRLKSMIGVQKGLRAPMAPRGQQMGFGIGSFAKQNPLTTFGIASSIPQGAYLAGKIGAATPGAVWEGTKRWADYVVPGDQSRWWKDKEPPKGVPLNPNLQMNIPTKKQVKGKELTDAQRKAFANAQRNERVEKYLQMMGYDQSKKTAIADALIDASKIVSDRGTLDRKNITGELINPIIQATSRRLDKPQQIREAVGLMMTKAGLEKEMYDAKPGTVAKNVQDMVKSGKYTEEEAWAIATKGSQGAVADIQGAIATGKVGAGDWPAFVRSTGAQHGENVEVITDEQIKEKYKDQDKIPSAMEIIAAEGITDDGIYVIGSETVRIKDGKPTQLR